VKLVRSLIVVVLLALVSTASEAQKIIRVIAAEGSIPIPFASVSIEGGAFKIADTTGVLALGQIKSGPIRVEARRLGYGPFNEKVVLTDTTTVITIVLARMATKLATVNVLTAGPPVTLALQGFYRRALERQKGAGSGWFIGPEEIERTDPQVATDVLKGIPGLNFTRATDNRLVAVDGNGCHVTVVIDGTAVRAPSETGGGGKTPMSITGGLSGASTRSRTDLNDQNSVFIDNHVSANGLAAIEYYRRGANIPIEMQQLDVGCGVLAVWTGGRKPVK